MSTITGDAKSRRGEDFAYVIIRLAEGIGSPADSRLSAVIARHDLRGLADLLRDYGVSDAARLVRAVEPERILELERAARNGPLPPLRSLTAYWRLDLRHRPEAMADLCKRLHDVPGVEHAYPDGPVVAASVNPPGNNPQSATQGYLRAAATGIDAVYAWTQLAGDGSGIGFFDVEAGWNVSHAEFAANPPTLIAGVNHYLGAPGSAPYDYVALMMRTADPAFADGNHGTGALGIVVGGDNAIGVVGIAPRVSSVKLASVWDGTEPGHVVDALVKVIDAASPGDVVMLEVQTGRGQLTGWPDNHPIEIKDEVCDAIRAAISGRNLVVVEAAGNAGVDLDQYVAPQGAGLGKKVLARGDAAFRESGAIMVGAATSAVPHARHAVSNFGSRVDCYAWGENVATCGLPIAPAFELVGSTLIVRTPENLWFRGDFNATSAATPIVAGAAVLVQSMYAAVRGTRLASLQVRDVLSDRALNTASATPTADRIGVMPNLRNVAGHLNLVPDVYLRDGLGDPGSLPWAGALATSPDIIVRAAPVPDGTAAFGESSATKDKDDLDDTITYGSTAHVYLRFRNRGGSDAQGVTGRVWWSEPATLVTPDLWSPIVAPGGVVRTAPITVPTGGQLVVSPPLEWPSTQVPSAGHYCLVAMADCARDPAPPLPGSLPPGVDEWAWFLGLIRNHNNVTWRNINVVDAPSGTWRTGRFLITGAPRRARAFEFAFDAVLPAGARMVLQVPGALGERMVAAWGCDAAPAERGRELRVVLPDDRARLRGLTLPAAARFPAMIEVAGVGDAGEGGEIAIRQFVGELEVGRLTWRFRPRRDYGTAVAG